MIVGVPLLVGSRSATAQNWELVVDRDRRPSRLCALRGEIIGAIYIDARGALGGLEKGYQKHGR